MGDLKDFFANYDLFREQFGNKLQVGLVILFVLLIAVILLSPAGQPAPAAPTRNPMELVASPNEPLMVEAIRMAQAREYGKGNAWSGDKRDGPTATFRTPGGSITLTEKEIRDANHYYPQLKSNPAIARSNSSTSRGGSTPAGQFSDGENDTWGYDTR